MKIGVIEKEKECQRDHGLVYSPVTVMIMTGQERCQESGTPSGSPMQVTVAQVLAPSLLPSGSAIKECGLKWSSWNVNWNSDSGCFHYRWWLNRPHHTHGALRHHFSNYS